MDKKYIPKVGEAFEWFHYTQEKWVKANAAVLVTENEIAALDDEGMIELYSFSDKFRPRTTTTRGKGFEFKRESSTDFKELVELRKKNAELEKALLKSHGWIAKAMMQGLNKIDCSDELLKIIAIRDLEQQAKGIDLALSDYPCMYGDTKVYVADLENRAKALREQAKQLKEQGG